MKLLPLTPLFGNLEILINPVYIVSLEEKKVEFSDKTFTVVTMRTGETFDVKECPLEIDYNICSL